MKDTMYQQSIFGVGLVKFIHKTFITGIIMKVMLNGLGKKILIGIGIVLHDHYVSNLQPVNH